MKLSKTQRMGVAFRRNRAEFEKEMQWLHGAGGIVGLTGATAQELDAQYAADRELVTAVATLEGTACRDCGPVPGPVSGVTYFDVEPSTRCVQCGRTVAEARTPVTRRWGIK